MERKKTAPNDFRNIIRRGELYGFDNRAIAFGGHVNFFEGAGIISSETDRNNIHQPVGNNAVFEGEQYSIDNDRRWGVNPEICVNRK